MNAYRAYATTWEHTSDQKKSQATNASEITFYGLLASAIGLATKSPETVIAGGSVGAAGTIYSKRYALEIQAHNYDLAAQSMQCMYMAAAPYQKKSFPDDLTVRNASLNSLITVRKKLRNLQNSLVLATPSFAELQTALSYTPVITKAASPGSKANTPRGLFPVSLVSEAETSKLLQAIKVCESML